MFKKPHNVVVCIDGPDPDNFVACLAASALMDVAAVIVTGRPVSTERNARPFDTNPHASRAVLRDNALHVKGVLMRHGREYIPVFAGGYAPYSTIPHNRHVHERVTDIFDDAHAGHVVAGDIHDAVAYLAQLPGTLHIVGGGPLTDVSHLIHQPMLFGRFGLLAAQLGMFGSPRVKVLAGGRRQFNVLADPRAAWDILMNYPAPVYMVPTDITKLPEHAFGSPEELAALATSSCFGEIVKMYEAWCSWRGNLSSEIHVHDFHPALLMHQLLEAYAKGLSPEAHSIFGPYGVQSTGIGAAPYLPHERDRWGEIDLAPTPTTPNRFVVSTVQTKAHPRLLAAALNAPARQPRHLIAR